MDQNSLLIVGATGLVGKACLSLADEDHFFQKIVVLTRRPLPEDLVSSKVITHQVNFDRLRDFKNEMQVSHVFCTLGTTIRKAGSQENFYKVDFTYADETARLASEQGAKHFYLVTSLGSKANSRIFYYRIKGQLEEVVQKLDYHSINIFRPSFLLGEREEKRLAESVAKRLARGLDFVLSPKYKAVPARSLAMAMMEVAKKERSGYQIIENAEIHSLADRYQSSSI